MELKEDDISLSTPDGSGGSIILWPSTDSDGAPNLIPYDVRLPTDMDYIHPSTTNLDNSSEPNGTGPDKA
jgi:hypothetical protein